MPAPVAGHFVDFVEPAQAGGPIPRGTPSIQSIKGRTLRPLKRLFFIAPLRKFILRQNDSPLTRAEEVILQAVPAHAAQLGSFGIPIIPLPNLANNAAALAAFNRAWRLASPRSEGAAPRNHWSDSAWRPDSSSSRLIALQQRERPWRWLGGGGEPPIW